ncbi:MAG: FtsQ-type POTRA domain-containing protein [Oscillospiraceae bacterium]|nr:FtsQ-type POTRA domain-containing protein [Oscillospiraceae bacterium]
MSKGRNKKRRRRARAFAWLLLLGAAACIVLSLTVFFPIVSVDVTGDVTSYTPQQIVDASGIRVGKNLFLFSAPAAEKRICEQLPYIESAQIHRRLSGQVVVECTESTRLLVVPCTSGCLVINSQLKIVAQEQENTAGRTEVYGLTPRSPRTGAALDVTDEEGTEYLAYVVDAIMGRDMLSHITAVNVSDKLNLSIVYEDRLYVMLGTASNIDYKFKMLARVVGSELSASDTGYIDLSDSGKATYKMGAFSLPDGYKTPAVIAAE